MAGDTKHTPFDSGSQFGDWSNSNCCRCTKAYEANDDKYVCEIEQALFDAMFYDGDVSEDIAERMGYLDNSPLRQQGFSYVWPCKEWEPTEQAKKEYVIRERTN